MAPLAHQDSVSAPQQRRMEFGPTASRVAQKRASKAARMLARLESGPARTAELMALGGSGFSSRLAEIREQLRAEGLTVKCEPDEDGAWYEIVPSEPTGLRPRG